MKPVTFHPDARLESTAAGRYYAQRSLVVAQHFYVEMDEVVSEIRARPALRTGFPLLHHLPRKARFNLGGRGDAL